MFADQGSCAYATGNRFSVLQATVQGPFCFIGWYHQSGVVRRLNAYFRSVQGQKAVTFHAVSPVLGGRWRRVTYSERRTGAIQVSSCHSELVGLNGVAMFTNIFFGARTTLNTVSIFSFGESEY